MEIAFAVKEMELDEEDVEWKEAPIIRVFAVCMEQYSHYHKYGNRKTKVHQKSKTNEHHMCEHCFIDYIQIAKSIHQKERPLEEFKVLCPVCREHIQVEEQYNKIIEIEFSDENKIDFDNTIIILY